MNHVAIKAIGIGTLTTAFFVGSTAETNAQSTLDKPDKKSGNPAIAANPIMVYPSSPPTMHEEAFESLWKFDHDVIVTTIEKHCFTLDAGLVGKMLRRDISDETSKQVQGSNYTYLDLGESILCIKDPIVRPEHKMIVFRGLVTLLERKNGEILMHVFRHRKLEEITPKVGGGMANDVKIEFFESTRKFYAQGNGVVEATATYDINSVKSASQIRPQISNAHVAFISSVSTKSGEILVNIARQVGSNNRNDSQKMDTSSLTEALLLSNETLLIKGGLIMLLKHSSEPIIDGWQIRKIAPFPAFDKIKLNSNSEIELIGKVLKPALTQAIADFVLNQGKYSLTKATTSANK